MLAPAARTVILGALFGIGQRAVSLCDLQKLFLRLLLILVGIGVRKERLFTVRLLDLRDRRFPRHS